MKKVLLLSMMALFTFSAAMAQKPISKSKIGNNNLTIAKEQQAIETPEIDNKFEMLKAQNAKALELDAEKAMEEQKAMDSELKGKFGAVKNAAAQAAEEEQKAAQSTLKPGVLKFKDRKAALNDSDSKLMKEHAKKHLPKKQ